MHQRFQARYAEIDLARGVAVLSMIVYHLAFDLGYFYHWDIDVGAGGWRALQLGVGSTFLLLVGASATILNARMRERGVPVRAIWKRFFKRGSIVLLCAALVSLVTFLIEPAAFVRFGVLHLIGVSLFLLPLFLPLREWNVVPGIAALALGRLAASVTVTTWTLIPFNILPRDYQALDHYPLLPWFGVILVGAGLGHAIYVRLLSLRSSAATRGFEAAVPAPLQRKLLWPGRHSLMIYLVHQPILLFLLWLILWR